jgi:hypothetical protein
MPASVRIDQSRLQRLLSAVGGPGDRLLRRKAERVAALARQYSAHNGSIAEGIVVGPVVDKSIKVISTNPHTLFVDRGTRAHKIRPRRRGGYLRFVVDGRVVYAREVSHPGFTGTRFMERALRDGA